MMQSGLSEQDLLADLLNQEKQLLSAYTVALQESTCPQLRKLLINQFHQTSKDQFELFDQMRQKGYYQSKDATDTEISLVRANLKNVQNELV